MPFPKRARFIYLTSDFNTEKYWNNLHSSIRTENPAFASALNAFGTAEGIMLRRHFDILCGSPIRQKGQHASSVILYGLLGAKLISEIGVEGLGDCLVLGWNQELTSRQIKGLRARLLTEGVLLSAIRGWAARMNMSSANSIRIRDESPAPQVGNVRFDLSGPCYLHPMVDYKDGKALPGFLAADVAVGVDMQESMVATFLRKCTLVSSVRGQRPLLPMLIADSFHPSALRLCRSRGVIATRAETLFGRDVARALEDLIKTLTNAASTPSQIEGLFKRLGAIEGAASNLRGALFELVVAHCVRSIEGGQVDVGVMLTDKDHNRAEVDVLLTKERVVRIYECKGYQPTSKVSLQEVELWVKKKVPTIHAALRGQDRFSSARISFEFWTCGDFEEEAVALLEAASQSTNKYRIAWKNRASVRAYVAELTAPGLRKILDEHYMNHPIARKQH